MSTRVSTVNAALLGGVRRDIDRIDAELVRLLAERYRLVLAAASLKGEAYVPPSPQRQAQVLSAAERHAETHALPPAVARAAFEGILSALAHNPEVNP